ncbi:MAG: polyphosphate kinase 2 family protein, partial [Candidatus Acidiferrum sp.]
EEMIQNTATKRAPWYVVPADNKWYAHAVVSSTLITVLEELDLSFPDVDREKKKELEKVRESLLQKNA